MCNHLNGPWVQRAQNFLATNLSNRNGQWHTVNFLLQNGHYGITNRVSIESILQHLSSNGIGINREAFQQTILGELKKQGIVATLVYPGPQGGVFIPCTEDEVRQVADQILNRVDSEVENLAGISQQTSFSNLISRLSRILSWIRERIHP